MVQQCSASQKCPDFGVHHTFRSLVTNHFGGHV